MAEAVKKKSFAAQAKWREKNPMKRWAHIATASALNRGLLHRQPCEVCGDEKVDAHHDDYEKPMSVRWLCRRHHQEAHRLLKAEEVE